MKTIVLLLTFIYGTTFSQTNLKKKDLSDIQWTLISGQDRNNAFSADTLTFVNCNKCGFSDSIQLKPFLEFLPFDGPSFEFGFNTTFEKYNGVVAGRGCTDIQYGYWSINKRKNIITLTLLKENGTSDDFREWTVIKKIKYNANLSTEKLTLIKI